MWKPKELFCLFVLLKLLLFPTPLIIFVYNFFNYLLNELVLPLLVDLSYNPFNMCTSLWTKYSSFMFLSALNFLRCALCHLVFVFLPVGKVCRGQFYQSSAYEEKHQLDHHNVSPSLVRTTLFSSTTAHYINLSVLQVPWVLTFDTEIYISSQSHMENLDL